MTIKARTATTNKRKRLNRPSDTATSARSNAIEQSHHDDYDEDDQQVVKKKRYRRSNAQVIADRLNDASLNSPRSSAPKEMSQRSSQKSARRRASASQAEDAAEDPHQSQSRDDAGVKQKEYQHIRSTKRRIPKAVIQDKWTPLPKPAIDRIGQLLLDVERATVMRLQDEQKRLQASTAIQLVSRRVQRKLIKGLPFPPATRALKEDDFEFEKVLDNSRVLEAQLTPMLHSIELLKAELAKEESKLAMEQEELMELESNAKDEFAESNKTLKRLHYLVRPDMGTSVPETSLAYLSSNTKKSSRDLIDVSRLTVCLPLG